MKIVTVIGARPQIIKAAALSRAIKKINDFENFIDEVIVHTGQHYDPEMSEVFFRELGIPQPDYNLGVGSGHHGTQTAAMIDGIEKILLDEKPDWLVVYGDTNSTLAAAIAASKIHISVAHIEAGLRSFNKSMPEEINRIACDHVSTLLFTPTKTGFQNLISEGFKITNSAPYTIDKPGIFHCGDVMYDNSLYYGEIARSKTNIAERLQLLQKPFYLATIHRNNNTDDPERLNNIFGTLLKITETSGVRMILPLHPRTKKMMEAVEPELKARLSENTIHIVPPASFLEMIVLEQLSQMVFTDSGGVQKEAYFFERPCIILRPETEWVELVQNGTARICDADPERIMEAFRYFNNNENLEFPPVFGDGNAAKFILNHFIFNV